MNTLPTPLHGAWQDSVADWAAQHQRELRTMPIPLLMDECSDWDGRAQPACVGTCETVAGCSCAPMPLRAAEACSELLADPDEPPFVFPLEPILTRHPWFGLTLLALVCFVWLCVDGYLENLPQ